MEIIIALFISLWLTISGVLALRRLKKDYHEMEDTKK